MTKNSDTITKAYWALGDYFSRLGGSARYFDMSESDIPLYIGCELAKRASSTFQHSEYLTGQFLQAAAPVIPEVQKHLSSVTASPTELAQLIYDFAVHVDKKYKSQHRSARWERFLAFVSEFVAQQGAPADGLASASLRQARR